MAHTNRVHNAYMLASAWRLVGQTLEDIADELGGNDNKLRAKLQKDPDFRARYLELYDHVNKLVDVGQNKFALLATTARESSLLSFMALFTVFLQVTGASFSRGTSS